MATMQKALLVGALAIFLLCSAGGLYAYRNVQIDIPDFFSDAVETEVAYQVQLSMAHAVDTRSNAPCTVTLSSSDVDFSTYLDTSVGSSIDVSNSDATIVNGQVEIGLDGIDLSAGELHARAVPEIQDGTFILTDIDYDRGLSSFLFSGSAFTDGFVQGVNDGLRAAQLTPTSVEIAPGTMIIGCHDGAVSYRSFTT